MTEPTANRKHLILDAACRAIAATGAAAVRVSDVAREAGVSTALVHYYFPSRAEVIVEGAARRLAACVDDWGRETLIGMRTPAGMRTALAAATAHELGPVPRARGRAA